MANVRCIKNKDNPFVILNKKVFEISTLSWEAKGVWGFLMSKTDDWETNTNFLCENFPGSRDRMLRILKELQDHQLCHFEKKRKNGRWTYGGYTIFESPEEFQKMFTQQDFPAPESSTPEKTATYLKKEEYLKNDNTLEKNTPKGVQKSPAKTSYGQFNNVKLTEEEYEKLKECFGIVGTNHRIDKLSIYIESKGAKYLSHYATLLNWERRENPNFKISTEKKQSQWTDISKKRKE